MNGWSSRTLKRLAYFGVSVVKMLSRALSWEQLNGALACKLVDSGARPLRRRAPGKNLAGRKPYSAAGSLEAGFGLAGFGSPDLGLG